MTCASTSSASTQTATVVTSYSFKETLAKAIHSDQPGEKALFMKAQLAMQALDQQITDLTGANQVIGRIYDIFQDNSPEGVYYFAAQRQYLLAITETCRTALKNCTPQVAKVLQDHCITELNKVVSAITEELKKQQNAANVDAKGLVTGLQNDLTQQIRLFEAEDINSAHINVDDFIKVCIEGQFRGHVAILSYRISTMFLKSIPSNFLEMIRDQSGDCTRSMFCCLNVSQQQLSFSSQMHAKEWCAKGANQIVRLIEKQIHHAQLACTDKKSKNYDKNMKALQFLIFLKPLYKKFAGNSDNEKKLVQQMKKLSITPTKSTVSQANPMKGAVASSEGRKIKPSRDEEQNKENQRSQLEKKSVSKQEGIATSEGLNASPVTRSILSAIEE